MEILIVEDDERLAYFLERAFTAEGWNVRKCGDYSALLDFIECATDPCDVAILDRMLYGDDSLILLPKFKNSFPQAKVLFLSALDSSGEKTLAINKGADDYMSKPYSLSELCARVRALARRSSGGVGALTQKRLGNLNFDFLSHQVSVGSHKIDLTNKEFKILCCLAERPEAVLNKMQLLSKVWDINSMVESNVVEATLSNLRRKLEAAGAKVKVMSRRNIGYWLEA